LNEGEEAASELVEASGDAPVLLELLEEAFNQVALLVEGPVAGPGFLVCLGRDAVIRAGDGEKSADSFGPVSLIRQNSRSFQRHGGQRRFRFPGIVKVASRQVNVDRVPEAVDDHMNLCRLPAPADPDVLVNFAVYRPFFAPALC
jgi:hypothetical protein